MRLVLVALFTAAAMGCAGFIDHVVATDRRHEAHHGRGVQNVEYENTTTHLKFAPGSTHVGNPSGLMLAAADAHRIALAADDNHDRAAALTDEINVCNELLRARGAVDMHCTIITVLEAQREQLLVAAQVSGGGYLLPVGGYWGAGADVRYLDTLAGERVANQVFPGGAADGRRRLTYRETTDRLIDRQQALEGAVGNQGAAIRDLAAPASDAVGGGQ